MKRQLSGLLIFAMLLTSIPACAQTTTQHGFPLTLPQNVIPEPFIDPSDPADPSSDGLDSGAIVGITLGSIAGVAALGGLAWFFAPLYAMGLNAGEIYGLETPILPICIDEKYVERLKLQANENRYLIKALEINGVRECPGSKYVLIPDSYVNNKTFNGVFFRVPREMIPPSGDLQIKVTQVSDPFSAKEFEGRIFTHVKETNITPGSNYAKRSIMSHEIKFTKTISQEPAGVVQKLGTINSKSRLTQDAVIIISHNKAGNAAPMRYAYVIEFTR